MAVPNHSDVPKTLFETGEYDLTNHDDQAKFVDDCVLELNARDPRWGFLKKTSGTMIHNHSEDGALYLSDTPGQSQHVDFIAGAGGPNPHPAWGVDVPRYSRSDWYPPDEHPPVDEPGPPTPEPPASFKPNPYPDENTAGKAFQTRVKQAYTDAGRKFPDPSDHDAFRHFMRYGHSSSYLPEPEAADKHIKELRDQLGL